MPNDIPTSRAPALQNRLGALLLPKRTRIHMAEDDPVSARILQIALSKFGYEPIIARNGDEAWEKFDQEPVVFVTAHSDFGSRAQSTLSGGNDFIAKPFLLVELAVKALTWLFKERPQTLSVTMRQNTTRAEAGSHASPLPAHAALSSS